jgi:two-component system, response regulator
VKEDGPKYLLVEDNNYDLELALFDFEEHGVKLEFHVARDGGEALEYLLDEGGNLKVNAPEAVFLDLHMPKVDGLHFLREIRKNEQTKNIRVVVLNSSISPGELEECQRLGVRDFIGKPLEYENFLSAIENIDKRADDANSNTFASAAK